MQQRSGVAWAPGGGSPHWPRRVHPYLVSTSPRERAERAPLQKFKGELLRPPHLLVDFLKFLLRSIASLSHSGCSLVVPISVSWLRMKYRRQGWSQKCSKAAAPLMSFGERCELEIKSSMHATYSSPRALSPSRHHSHGGFGCA